MVGNEHMRALLQNTELAGAESQLFYSIPGHSREDSPGLSQREELCVPN